jgi:secondary thiamine-phosphate synthase enzyme
MPDIIVYSEDLTVTLDTGVDIVDITDELSALTTDSGVKVGTLSATVVGSTGSITTIEYEPGVVEDLKAAIERMAPQGMYYAHEMAWHDGNGHSHVQAAMMGPSINVPIRNGRLRLGTWQQVVVINHDNKPRRRPVAVTIIGKK